MAVKCRRAGSDLLNIAMHCEQGPVDLFLFVAFTFSFWRGTRCTCIVLSAGQGGRPPERRLPGDT